MSKYIIELDDNVQIITCIGVSTHGTIWVKGYDVDNLEELNSDYINEHYGELQDEAYKKGYDDGKKSVSEPDRIEVGDEVEDSGGDKTIVTNIHGNLFDGLCSDGSVMSDLFLDDNHKTGKHYDIASILEAMRNDR